MLRRIAKKKHPNIEEERVKRTEKNLGRMIRLGRGRKKQLSEEDGERGRKIKEPETMRKKKIY